MDDNLQPEEVRILIDRINGATNTTASLHQTLGGGDFLIKVHLEHIVPMWKIDFHHRVRSHPIRSSAYVQVATYGEANAIVREFSSTVQVLDWTCVYQGCGDFAPYDQEEDDS